jgi:deazaflavin-dependent oxidoreductase (nitroreductase family)
MMVDVRSALARGGLIEMTTIGRRSGQPRRIELAAHNIDGRIYVSGRPGRRDWIANVRARPHAVVHLRAGDGVAVDVPADVRPITAPEERRRVLTPIARLWRMDLGVMVRSAPLVEVLFDATPR